MPADRPVRTGPVILRRLHPQDAPAVSTISHESPKAANWTTESYKESCTWHGSVALVAEIANVGIIGFLIGRHVVGEAEILNLAVQRSYRRTGNGAALLAAALQEFRKCSATRVHLEVRESNAVAIAFYERHGFAQTGRRSLYYREPDEGAVLMEKKLTA